MGRAEFVEKGDDRVKRSFCALLLAGFLILGSVSTVFAAEMRTLSMSELTCEEIDGTKVDVRKMFLTTRATQRIDADIAAGKTVKDVAAYPLEVGDVVTMNLTFSPAEADMDFGLIAPDKKFYSFKGSEGSFKENIQVSMTGTYYLAIRNNSQYTVSVVGFVYY